MTDRQPAPHTTVIYDTMNKVPLVVASNVDLLGKPLEPFRGIGFFPDPRLLPSLYDAAVDRISPDRNYGRVPLLDWRQIGWAPSSSAENDASFLGYAPFSVLQPWSFYDGVWSEIDRRLFSSDARRLTILAGAILPPNGKRVDGAIIPWGYWKAAIHWDGSGSALAVEAYAVDVGTLDRTAQRATTTLAQIGNQFGIDFGASPAAASSPTAQKREAPTVYLQFAGLSRNGAVELSRKLGERGYHLPPEEPVDSAKGLAEVRYVRSDEEEEAGKLAQQTKELLAELGYGQAPVVLRHLSWVKQKPPRGTLELWVGLPQVVRTEANQAFIVGGASDGFLALRLLPSANSDLLAKMNNGVRVACGDSSADYPGWRPCTYKGRDNLPRNGFAFDRYLTPAN